MGTVHCRLIAALCALDRPPSLVTLRHLRASHSHETKPISLNVPRPGDCSGPLVRLRVHPVCPGSNQDIQQAMTPAEFKAAGLEKLSPTELGKLNAWLQGYREKAVKVAEKKANERAAREKTNLIVSRIDGSGTASPRAGHSAGRRLKMEAREQGRTLRRAGGSSGRGGLEGRYVRLENAGQPDRGVLRDAGPVK